MIELISLHTNGYISKQKVKNSTTSSAITPLFNKVDFFWINRDQASFEWFLSLLTQLEMEQSEQRGVLSEHFLDMHIYMTSALKKEDMKALGLQLALELIHEKKDKDLITGLKTRTKPGRPDWDQVI